MRILDEQDIADAIIAGLEETVPRDVLQTKKPVVTNWIERDMHGDVVGTRDVVIPVTIETGKFRITITKEKA